MFSGVPPLEKTRRATIKNCISRFFIVDSDAFFFLLSFKMQSVSPNLRTTSFSFKVKALKNILQTISSFAELAKCKPT